MAAVGEANANTNGVQEVKDTKDVKEEITENNKEETKDVNAETPTTAPANSVPAVPKGCKNPNFEKDVVYLYQFTRTPVLPSVSPYCLKLETWLRLADIKYENVDHKMKFRSKKGQLPFVELNGEEIADSSVIIKELSQKFNTDLDSFLNSTQKSISHTTISMIENHLLWVVMWWKMKSTDNSIKGYKMNLQQFLGTRMPNAILNIIFKYRYSIKGMKKVKAQGIGNHSAEEIHELGKHDLEVLSDMLGDKPYFFGDNPALLDIVAFANLAQIYFVDKAVEYPLRDYLVENQQNLVDHINRMKERSFPDWDEICKPLDEDANLSEEKKDAKGKDDEKVSEKKSKEEENATDAKEKDEKEEEKEAKDKAQENNVEGKKEESDAKENTA